MHGRIWPELLFHVLGIAVGLEVRSRTEIGPTETLRSKLIVGRVDAVR